MRDVWYWFMFGVMLTAAGANIYACFRSMMSWKRARKSWENAQAVLREASKLRDEFQSKLDHILTFHEE